MSSWAVQETAGEQLSRWKSEPCASCVGEPEENDGPVRFRVTAASKDVEEFVCARHLVPVVDALAILGRDAIVHRVRAPLERVTA